jgi:hypothetical protein
MTFASLLACGLELLMLDDASINRRPQVGYGPEIVHAAPVEQPGHINGAFHIAHHDLGVAVGHYRDQLELVSAKARSPRSRGRIEVYPRRPRVAGQSVGQTGFVAV